MWNIISHWAYITQSISNKYSSINSLQLEIWEFWINLINEICLYYNTEKKGVTDTTVSNRYQSMW